MKCPNCQKEIPANSKFCTFCGFQIPQVAAATAQPTPVTPQPQFGPDQSQSTAQSSFSQNASVSMEQTKTYAKNYWAYLVDGLKHPASWDKLYHRYFGIVSLVLNALLFALVTLNIGMHSTMWKYLGEMDKQGHTSYVSTFNSKTFFYSLLGSAIILLAAYTVNYLIKNFVLKDKSTDYLQDMTNFFHVSSLGLFLLAAALVLSLFGNGLVRVVLALMGLNLLMQLAAFATLNFKTTATSTFDKAYSFLIGAAVMVVVTLGLFNGIVKTTAHDLESEISAQTGQSFTFGSVQSSFDQMIQSMLDGDE